MMTITLPPEVESLLAEEARRQGTTAEALAVDCLRNRLRPGPTAEAPRDGTSLAEFLDGFIGTIDGSSEALSERTGQGFTEALLEKARGRRS